MALVFPRDAAILGPYLLVPALAVVVASAVYVLVTTRVTLKGVGDGATRGRPLRGRERNSAAPLRSRPECQEPATGNPRNRLHERPGARSTRLELRYGKILTPDPPTVLRQTSRPTRGTDKRRRAGTVHPHDHRGDPLILPVLKGSEGAIACYPGCYRTRKRQGTQHDPGSGR